MAQRREGGVGVDDGYSFADHDVAKDGEEGEDCRKGRFSLHSVNSGRQNRGEGTYKTRNGTMYTYTQLAAGIRLGKHFQAICQIANACSVTGCMCYDNDLVAPVNESL